MLCEGVLVGVAGCIVGLPWGAGDTGDRGKEDEEGEV